MSSDQPTTTSTRGADGQRPLTLTIHKRPADNVFLADSRQTMGSLRNATCGALLLIALGGLAGCSVPAATSVKWPEYQAGLKPDPATSSAAAALMLDNSYARTTAEDPQDVVPDPIRNLGGRWLGWAGRVHQGIAIQINRVKVDYIFIQYAARAAMLHKTSEWEWSGTLGYQYGTNAATIALRLRPD